MLDLGAADDKEMTENITAFKTERGATSITEERRLAYVAFTRARGQLLLSAHLWGDGKSPRLPSRFLTQVLEAGTHEDCRSRRSTGSRCPRSERPTRAS